MRGYFGIGVEGISKPMNAGAVLRTGHAFGADFAFFVSSHIEKNKINLSDIKNTSEIHPSKDPETLQSH